MIPVITLKVAASSLQLAMMPLISSIKMKLTVNLQLTLAATKLLTTSH